MRETAVPEKSAKDVDSQPFRLDHFRASPAPGVKHSRNVQSAPAQGSLYDLVSAAFVLLAYFSHSYWLPFIAGDEYGLFEPK